MVGDSYSGRYPFLVLGLNSICKMRSGRDGWIATVTDSEYSPSPRCSPSQTGPSGPGSWAEPGTGTGSAQEKQERGFTKGMHDMYLHTVLCKSFRHFFMFLFSTLHYATPSGRRLISPQLILHHTSPIQKELSSATRRTRSPATDALVPTEHWSLHHRDMMEAFLFFLVSCILYEDKW